MTHGHPFWWLLSWACVAWYSAITIYVAIRGARDVRTMLRRLADRDRREGRAPRDV
jgi:hypothetical protein